MLRDIVISRKGRDIVRDQLSVQLEMKMLGGELVPGERLPSTRALARMLHLNPNTVSAVYRRLEALGHILRRRGSGMFVASRGEGSPAPPPLAAFVHGALTNGIRCGYAPAEILSAVRRWISTPPPDRIVVFDPVREMAQLLARELREALGVPAQEVTVQDLEAAPRPRLAGALLAALPYQVKTFARFVPADAIEVLTIQMPDAVREALEALPVESCFLVVSSSPAVLEFAVGLVRALRGDEIQIHLQPLGAKTEWRPLLAVADLVVVDTVSAEVVRAAGYRRPLEMRILTAQAIERMRALLALPRNPLIATPARTPARRRSRRSRRPPPARE